MAISQSEILRGEGFRRLATIGGSAPAETKADRGIPYLRSSMDGRPVKIHDPRGLVVPGENVIFVKPSR